jgi:hypothetical protein
MTGLVNLLVWTLYQDKTPSFAYMFVRRDIDNLTLDIHVRCCSNCSFSKSPENQN